jgi:hypothetical protein
LCYRIRVPVWLLSIVEFGLPLEPGCKIGDHDSEVYEVRRLRSRSTPIAGAPRDLFVALHAGPGSVVVFVCLDAEQEEWSVSGAPADLQQSTQPKAS